MAKNSKLTVKLVKEKTAELLAALCILEDQHLSSSERTEIQKTIDEFDIHKEIALDAINGV